MARVLIVYAVLFVGLAAAPARAQLPAPPAQNEGPYLAQPEPSRAAPSQELLLDRLFARLRKASDVSAAKVIEAAIWDMWGRSGSPSADALLRQATSAMTSNRPLIALELLDTAVDIKPDFAEAWNKRATLFFMEGEYGRSLADIDKVLDLEPRHFGALYGLGMIRRELGDKSGALEAFRRALAVNPHLDGAGDAVEQLRPDVEQDI